MAKFSLPEWIKNLLIILLSVSAAWLLTLTPLYKGSPLEARVNAFTAAASETGETVARSLTAASPMAAAVVTGEGRYGVQYDSAGVNAVFDSLGALLGEALHTAGTPFSITERRWREALGDTGLYFDFCAAAPLSALTVWLRGEEGAALSAQARRIALAPGDSGGEAWLFWQEAGSGRFYACATALDVSLQLLPSLEGWPPNSAFFAFEEESYAACDPYTLLTDVEGPAVYAASNPLAGSAAALERVLDALGYSTASGASYAISGGTRYTDGALTLQLSDAGALTYAWEEGEPVRFPVSSGEGEPTLAQSIEAARQIAASTLGALCGDGELALLSAREENGALAVTFGYRLDGVPVALYDGGWAARFVIRDRAVTGFTLHFRAYAAAGETSLLLPELQAAAALSSMEEAGKELLLCYVDGGGALLSAAWIAN